MQTIIGTGLSGLVGSRLVSLLGNQYKFQNFDITTGIDITNDQIIEEKICSSEGNIVVHLAAFTDVDKAWDQNGNKNDLSYKINVLGTKNIAKLCHKYNKYLIHISTDFVFDGQKRTPYIENDICLPIEWYGKTKLWAEEEVVKSNCRYLILRIAFPYKAGEEDKKYEPSPKLDLVRKIKQKLAENQILFMFFDQIITPTFIDDIVRVLQYCFENNPQGLYHCTGSSYLSPYDLAAKIAEVFSYDKSLIKKSTVYNKFRENSRPRQVYQAIDNQKLVADFGIKLNTIDEALKIIKGQAGFSG